MSKTRRVVHECEKFRVERLTETGADGNPHERDIVVHNGAAVILPLLPENNIVMIRNHRVTIDAELLELPAGTLDPGEAPDTCAARELEEETGYSAKRLRPLLRFYPTPGFCTEEMHVFIATDLTPGTARPEPTEKIRVTTLTLDAALAAIRDGAICDAKTIIALLYYERFVRSAGAGA